MGKIRRLAFTAVILIAVSFIFYYAGHYLSTNKLPEIKNTQKAEHGFPVEYRSLSTVINGNKQKINILEIDLKDKTAEIRPVLSHNSVFGFEHLSDMVSRSGAYAGINAGFFYEFGQPSGMVVLDGRMITDSTGKYPVLVIDGDKAALKQINTRLWLEHNGKIIDVDGINRSPYPGEIILYTPEYGTNNRAELKNIYVTIRDGRIEKTGKSEGNVDIPEDGAVLSLFEPVNLRAGNYCFKEGEWAEFRYEPNLGNGANAYECGSWIVKEGKVVIGGSDEWIGVMTNRDPRTAVGIKADGKVVLVAVDGRQPGYSMGFTGKELGEFFLELGVTNAAMLDGGASTEMIVEGKIVNRPSFKGEERMLGGALIVKVKD